MAPHFLLEELGVEYQLQLIDRKSNEQKSAQYLELNPLGKIPTLIDNGLVITESSAICMHLCDENSNLIPQIGDEKRALFYQWMMYLTNTLQAELMIYFYPENHCTQAKENIIEIQDKRITDIFKLLDHELAKKRFLVGDDITACDFYLLMLAIWADELKQPPLSFPNLSRYLKSLTSRPSIITVCQKENLSLADYQ